MMERWNPMAEFDRILSDMDRMFSHTFGRTRLLPRLSAFIPLIDMYDTGEHLVVRALIPGAKADDIDVTIEQNVLTLAGRYGDTMSEDEARNVTWYRREIGSGRFAETITLPAPVQAENAEATFENGILTLTLPKVEQARARKIPVRSPRALVGSLS